MNKVLWKELSMSERKLADERFMDKIVYPTHKIRTHDIKELKRKLHFNYKFNLKETLKNRCKFYDCYCFIPVDTDKYTRIDFQIYNYGFFNGYLATEM